MRVAYLVGVSKLGIPVCEVALVSHLAVAVVVEVPATLGLILIVEGRLLLLRHHSAIHLGAHLVHRVLVVHGLWGVVLRHVLLHILLRFL